MRGELVRSSRKILGQVRGLYLHGNESPLTDDTELYSVEWVAPGGLTEGSLLWGCTHLHGGQVEGEYFMTHGHYHAIPSRAEYYFPVSGSGLLLRMERSGRTWAEEMSAGKVHYIDGQHAHRVVNTGQEPLVFWASWPGDAGYDYASIAEKGFGLRVVERDGKPVLVENAG
jgi:glucose-6-phosphate isomerase